MTASQCLRGHRQHMGTTAPRSLKNKGDVYKLCSYRSLLFTMTTFSISFQFLSCFLLINHCLLATVSGRPDFTGSPPEQAISSVPCPVQSKGPKHKAWLFSHSNFVLWVSSSLNSELTSYCILSFFLLSLMGPWLLLQPPSQASLLFHSHLKASLATSAAFFLTSSSTCSPACLCSLWWDQRYQSVCLPKRRKTHKPYRTLNSINLSSWSWFVQRASKHSSTKFAERTELLVWNCTQPNSILTNCSALYKSSRVSWYIAQTTYV